MTLPSGGELSSKTQDVTLTVKDARSALGRRLAVNPSATIT